MKDKLSIVYTYFIAFLSGCIFQFLLFPLPWILGPVTGLMISKLLINFNTVQFRPARNIAFSLLGIQIGLTFTSQTFVLIGPYFIPYTVLSLVIVAVSLFAAYLISRKTAIDPTTSMIGSAPGGLSAMIAVSETFKGNTVLVTIFHTIRLLSVLFILPFVASHWLYSPVEAATDSSIHTSSGSMWTISIYIIAFLISYQLQSKIPASLVILPMLFVGGLQAAGVSLFLLPNSFFVAAQLIIGVHLGHAVSISDLKKAGRYCFFYFALSVLIIGLGIGLGLLLSYWTGMSIVTAVLSLAPGGLVEMAITAQNTGGQPSIVSSLQTIRLLTIVLLLPIVFQWILPRMSKT